MVVLIYNSPAVVQGCCSKTDEVNPTTRGFTYLIDFLLALHLDPEGYNHNILLFTFKALKSQNLKNCA
jgi:hypothetical protein